MSQFDNDSAANIGGWRTGTAKKLGKYFAQKNQIQVTKDKIGEPPFSVDENVLHTSAEGKVLENPWLPPPDYVFSRTKNIEDTPNKSEEIIITFKGGDPIKVNEQSLSPYKILKKLNNLGFEHGIGRVDMVENRFIGMKSRGIYETPGGTILYYAHRAIESITLDRKIAHEKDLLVSE